MSFFIKKPLLYSAVFITVLFIALNIIRFFRLNNHTDLYIIKSYKNTVALYKNDKLLKTYDSIVLNTLPQSDILNFNKGITVETQAQADDILEDYDG